MAGDGDVACGEEGGGEVGDFVGFARGRVKVGGVDDASVGEGFGGGDLEGLVVLVDELVEYDEVAVDEDNGVALG